MLTSLTLFILSKLLRLFEIFSCKSKRVLGTILERKPRNFLLCLFSEKNCVLVISLPGERRFAKKIIQQNFLHETNNCLWVTYRKGKITGKIYILEDKNNKTKRLV